MAAAGAIVKRKMSVVQVEKQLQKKYSAEFVRGVLERHDTGRSGGLTWNELKEFLRALHPTREGDITEGEIKWVIQMAMYGIGAGKQEVDGEWMLGKMQLSGKALEVAAKEWLQYLQHYDEISGRFDKRSPGHTGVVDKAQLTLILIELNDGNPVDETDVDKVMEHASIVTKGKLSKPEMIKAISIWYSIADEKELVRQQTMAKEMNKKNQSACCTLS